MRPLRVDLHGFTVFREQTTVDLTDVDFFALVGPTGSGKSTVLDAICFVLYGTVPRWGDRRRIDNALAPSAAEARVRLVFEAGEVRYVATRVVRRDGKGKVSTSHAGLEQLPPGFDLTWFDRAPADRAAAEPADAGQPELGIVLAGTPAEMDKVVSDVVGLPYEQFTSCVVLPQGEFARFLHAKPAERQEILVNLLGLRVYQRIGERAGMVQRENEARAVAARGLLAEVTGTDSNDAALAAAEAAVAAAHTLVARVEQELPALAEATAAGQAAQADLARVERDLAALGTVRVPTGVATLGDEVAAARQAAAQADTAVLAAEEREEKAQAELATAGDKTALLRLVDAHRQRAAQVTRTAELVALVERTRAGHDAVAATLATARAGAQRATKVVTAAQRDIETAQAADRAASLRVHLVAGEPCPVCQQPVATIPGTPAPALAAARARHAQAEQAARAATKAADGHDRDLREADRALAVATAQHAESTQRLAIVEELLAAAPTLSAVETGLAAIAVAEQAAVAATESVRAARQAARTHATRARQFEERMGQAWREFDRVRDGLAPFGPPPADRADLVGSWQALRAWAQAAQAEQVRVRDATLEVAELALAAVTRAVAALTALFSDAGLSSLGAMDLPARAAAADPSGYRQAAALAVERATAAHRRVLDQREQAARLTEQVAAYERAAAVAKALALHLRADRFERWLLAEALDALVLGASVILRQLTAGQYDLVHDKGELFVVDHSDAGLRRAVRTLSGGETFQAALALALALSEQLAGLSTTSARLGSIMLDEGFGTLDAGTLDIVAATLDGLADRGDRMVGVVTHVSDLAERIPVRFEVSKDARGVAKVVRSG